MILKLTNELFFKFFKSSFNDLQSNLSLVFNYNLEAEKERNALFSGPFFKYFYKRRFLKKNFIFKKG